MIFFYKYFFLGQPVVFILSGNIGSILKPSGRPSRNIGTVLLSSGNFRTVMKPSGKFWDHLEISKQLWNHLEDFEVIRKYTDSFETVWNIGTVLKLSGIFWTRQKISRQNKSKINKWSRLITICSLFGISMAYLRLVPADSSCPDGSEYIWHICICRVCKAELRSAKVDFYFDRKKIP